MESNPNGDKEPTEPTEEDEKKIEQIRKEIEKMKFGGAHRKKGETVKAAGNVCYIPMSGRVESLNASVACAVMMYEAKRQRK